MLLSRGRPVRHQTLLGSTDPAGAQSIDLRTAPGYKDNADAWLSTANVMARIGFANALAAGQVPGVKVETAGFAGKDAAAIAHDVLNRDASPQTLSAIERGL